MLKRADPTTARQLLLARIRAVRSEIAKLPPGSEAYAEAHERLNHLLDALVEASRP